MIRARLNAFQFLTVAILSLLLGCCHGSISAETEVTADGSLSSSSVPYLLHKPQSQKIIYGTAWKKGTTAKLVYDAIQAGFRRIDTACQPKHYNEPGVGAGWTAAARDLGLTRNDFWLQTKYTSLNGQDVNSIPYDKNAPLDERVRQSLNESFKNLQTDYIDSIVMHGPEDSWEKNLIVWREFEKFVEKGMVGKIGISKLPEWKYPLLIFF